MTSNPSSVPKQAKRPGDRPRLEANTIRRIEQALLRVGDFGEIRLIVVKGQIKFIQVTQSESLNEPQPGVE